MKFFKYFLIAIVILALLDPTEGGWLRRKLKKLGRGIKKVAKKTVKAIKKVGCKILFGVGCPAAVGVVGTALTVGTTGVGSMIVGAGVIAGKHACHVRKSRCKRSVEMTEVLIPFSDEMSDYDMNGDKLVTYEEFVFAVLGSVNLADPEELIEPFLFADFDGNGVLDTDEFNGAPFLFAHEFTEDQIVSSAA
ncbi:EF-hand calcium-binding domain-containing protein 1-like [Mercenaria mercenaria]|uniref:EF-hand calcium-binding domain-containing protein 1-like n=1 Tax=Mercenaria mercenaria TaxID=6596 RepID=UPI00234E6EC3|nr:EF-hand calcium-binding domain-containing protein 1-like [Mercenaria mercenaria]